MQIPYDPHSICNRLVKDNVGQVLVTPEFQRKYLVKGFEFGFFCQILETAFQSDFPLPPVSSQPGLDGMPPKKVDA